MNPSSSSSTPSLSDGTSSSAPAEGSTQQQRQNQQQRSGGGTGGRLRVSGAGDNFLRVTSANRSNSRPTTRSHSPAVAITTMDGSAARNVATPAAALPDAASSHRGKSVVDSSGNNNKSGIVTRNVQSPPSSGNAPNLQNIDRATGGLPNIATRGFHMPPEILGLAEDPDQDNNGSAPQGATAASKRGGAMADLNKKARRRSIMALKASKSQAAAAAAVKRVSSTKAETDNIALDSSMVTALCYQGMEVVFASTAHHCVAGFCSRTNFLFQKLDLPSSAPLVSITSDSSSGMLVVAHQDGAIQTYIPLPTDPADLKEVGTSCNNNNRRPKSVYGRFRWIGSITINAAEVFYQPGESAHFCDRRQSKPGELLDISSSYNYKLLLAHQLQLAVFDVAPLDVQDHVGRGTYNVDGVSTSPFPQGKATLLWTTMLPSKVVTAKLSGDGQAVVAVLEGPNDGGKYGARTFIHDNDDGSKPPSRPPIMIERASSLGMVFKPGPFLQHPRPVTRISFRGLGHVTPASNPEERQGNDLLLTYCEGDSSVRIFNQNAWRQLMLWAAPPNSRADWIRGSSAFSLGDLETQKKAGNSRMLRPGSRRPSSNSAELSTGGNINSGLRNIRPAGSGSPTSAAGAWIAEITFRGAYPALRLSRLSYMKRGNDDSQPAHFESVAAILPAGSIVAGSILNADDMGLTIHGFWPAWNPWLSEPAGKESSNSLSGSAMQFLGLSSVPPPINGMFGETYAGGTHSPPTELRLVSAHPQNGYVALMDFPLWGDDDFGAMELGSPIRSVLALSEVTALQDEGVSKKAIVASMDYESSRLCANVGPDARSIRLFWRKAGSMALYSPQWRDEKGAFASATTDVAEPNTSDYLIDLSLVPVPLVLPPLRLPSGKLSTNEDPIVAIKWWPDESFGGPPLLVAITKSSTLLVYEIPPPMFALEPSMPNFDTFNGTSSVASGTELNDIASAEMGSDDEETIRQEYDVLVTPHPDFGLGLRLESPMDGLPAIAGSFKKNPLNDGMLPAEKTGIIQLGDELLSVNGVSLENMTFDDIIATVRNVGAEAGPGEPLKMRFRPMQADRSRKNSAVVHESFSVRSTEVPSLFQDQDIASGGRTHGRSQSDTGSVAALLCSNSAEAQQEFGRVIAVVRKAFAPIEGNNISDRLLVLPWGNGSSTSTDITRRLRASALIVYASGITIQVKCLELPKRTGLDKSRILDLSEFEIQSNVGSNTDGEKSVVLRSLKCVENGGERKCFVATDSVGGVTLLYFEFNKKTAYTGEGVPLEISHKQYRVVDIGRDFNESRLQAKSAALFACIRETESHRRTIAVWHSMPDGTAGALQAAEAVKDSHLGLDYHESQIVVEPSECDAVLIDFVFLDTGYLEAFPTIVAFLTTEAIVYQRRGGSKKWLSIARLSYPTIFTSTMTNSLHDVFGRLRSDKPLDEYPHFLQLIRSSISSYDEKNYILSDWHPEALLSLLCTEERGAKVAFHEDITRVLLWLSETVDASRDDNFYTRVPLLVAPFSSWGREVVGGSENKAKSVDDVSAAAALFAPIVSGEVSVSKAEDECKKKLRRLLSILDSRECGAKHIDTCGKSRSHLVSVASRGAVRSTDDEPCSVFPALLTTLHANEVRVLKAILKLAIDPPNFEKLDSPSQFALSLYSLHCALRENESQDEESNSTNLVRQSYSSFHIRSSISSAAGSKPKLLPQNASAGCLAALLSDYQDALVARIRKPGEKLDWATLRDLRIPFWLRSDEKLRLLCEEVGQKMYRDSKDILKSAVFFIVAGKKRTLTNLAAADNTESGRKFYKFLTSFDFTSERGRSAAEKNAFSLLGKNRYDSAAAFFLLAEPPILKSAVETIATKMEDIDFAFLVARLMGNPGNQALSFGLGGGLNFGGMGGGGGFAGSGSLSNEVTKDKETFVEWKHELGQCAKQLILDRGLPCAKRDSCFSSVQLLWLGRFDEASHFLTGLFDSNDSKLPSFSDEPTVALLHTLSKTAMASRDPTLTTINSFINFAAGPFLLKIMKASTRTRLASTLVVARFLSKAGIEVPALRSLTLNIDDAPFNDDIARSVSSELIPTPKTTNESNGLASSLFHPLSTSLLTKPKTLSNECTSSIFESFDAPPPPKPKASLPKEAMSSSIFDAFDAPPRPTQQTATPSPASGTMVSSIFDAFDYQSPPIGKATTAASGALTPSIFDSFDIPLAPTPKPPYIIPDPALGAMTSSVFDSFDVAPTLKPVGAVASSALASPILDSCDAPKPKKATSKAESAGTGFELADPSSGIQTNGSRNDRLHATELRRPPPLWSQWVHSMRVDTAARRLVRELATICSPYHCDAFEHAGFEKQPFVTSGASQVLQFHCDGDELIDDVRSLVQNISKLCSLDSELIVEKAIGLLHSPYQFYRIFFAVLLHLAVNHVELAEDVVRNSAQSLIERCYSMAFSNDKVANGRHCIAYMSGLVLKKLAIHMSWQIELCLWIHRGGALPLSGLALNEAICSVRIGFFVASWNRDFEVQETLLRQPPDCLLDESRGRQLWTSLKIIAGGSPGEKKVTPAGSGGWEFLVDCRRSEATHLLRPRPTGCFIIRPHPEDHGVFTLSFKTNLIPTQDVDEAESSSADEAASGEGQKSPAPPKKSSGSRPIKKEDVVQHAIIRLSDSGFRCGSFGPFGTLMKLLDAVSASLPFDLRFDLPPNEGIIKDEGSKPSPNSVFLRKLGMQQAEFSNKEPIEQLLQEEKSAAVEDTEKEDGNQYEDVSSQLTSDKERKGMFGLFLELLVVSDLRKQLSSVAAAEYDNIEWTNDGNDDVDSVGSVSDVSAEVGVEQEYAIAARVLRPFLTWSRILEVEIVSSLAPPLNKFHSSEPSLPFSLQESETSIEISTAEKSSSLGGGDSVIRQMIQPGSGVEFRTLRLGDSGENAMVVLFSKKEAVAWFVKNDVEKDEDDALERLRMMERNRVIEPVDLRLLAPKAYKKTKISDEDEVEITDNGETLDAKGIRYRLVDPWEVEPLMSREAETRGASLGRQHLLAFGLGRVASSCQHILRSMGGLHLLELWAVTRGGVSLTKALATVHAPWERSAGGDLLLHDGLNAEPSDYDNSIREHLYRNALFRRLNLPQRFVALIQVELLDLKNLTSPGGSLSLTVYSLLRLKRARSNAPLTSKARTLDSVATSPVKLAKSSGPNAPASWGSLVRFRYPLPEDTAIDGKSYDGDREALFKGPPSVLQVSVYEKKFMSDTYLGGADVKLDGLNSGGQLEEWVPLKTEDHGINWFARMRLTLRFELMCLSPETKTIESLHELAPSVGLQRIQYLCSMGGAQMDLKKSVSTPDLLSYLESMVY